MLGETSTISKYLAVMFGAREFSRSSDSLPHFKKCSIFCIYVTQLICLLWMMHTWALAVPELRREEKRRTIFHQRRSLAMTWIRQIRETDKMWSANFTKNDRIDNNGNRGGRSYIDWFSTSISFTNQFTMHAFLLRSKHHMVLKTVIDGCPQSLSITAWIWRPEIWPAW